MAPAIDDQLLRAPADWQMGDFFGNAHAELTAHPVAASLGVAVFVLLWIGRLVLPASARHHLRGSIILFAGWLVTFVIRAELVTSGIADETYRWVALCGVLALSLALINAVAVLLFDLLARRFGVPRIMRDVTMAVATAVVLVALLARSGVNLLQLITTSAVITAVIGLSLQDTLGNIISGVALQLDSAFNIGDWVRVDDKATGRVREIRWRSTLIETRDGDQVIFPNTLVNRAQVVRFQHGPLQHRQWVYFHAALRHPPNLVIETVNAALVGTPNVSEIIKPDCIVWEFDEYGVKYAVRYRIIDILPDDPTNSEVRKRIWYALHRVQIEMSLPNRSVQMTEVGADADERHHAHELERRMRWLDRVPLLKPLDEAERRRIAEGLKFLPFARDEMIIRQGLAGDSLFVLLKGNVAVRFDVDGQMHEVARLGPGEFFGEMSLLTGAPRRATIVACEDAECYVLDRALMEGVIRANPKLAEQISALLVERERVLAVEQAKAHAHVPQSQRDLLSRIRGFFGIS